MKATRNDFLVCDCGHDFVASSAIDDEDWFVECTGCGKRGFVAKDTMNDIAAKHRRGEWTEKDRAEFLSELESSCCMDNRCVVCNLEIPVNETVSIRGGEFRHIGCREVPSGTPIEADLIFRPQRNGALYARLMQLAWWVGRPVVELEEND